MKAVAGFTLLAAFAAVLIVGTIRYRDYQQEINAKTKIENELKSANLLLEQRLRASERGRIVLVLRVDSLSDIVKPLVRVNHHLDSILKKVRGTYNNRTVTQLETEMIKRAQ